MSTQLSNDNYGRSITLESASGRDIYTIVDPVSGATFTIDVKTGSSQANVYQTINSMPVHAPTPNVTQIYTDIVLAAMDFGQSMMVQFAVSNIMAGITQAGKTQALIDYTANLASCLTTGSLYAAMADIQAMIADTSPEKTNLAPFITNNILYQYLNKIQSYLGLANTQNPGS